MATIRLKVRLTQDDLRSPARKNKKINETIANAIDRILDEAKVGMKKVAGEKFTEIQKGRFANDGAYNGHDRWAENTPATKEISKKGAAKKPLQDTGELKSILTDPDKWNESLYLVNTRGGVRMDLTPPEEAEANPYFYNERQYIQPNIYKVISKDPSKFFHVARPYLDITDQDVEEVTDVLTEYIYQVLGNKL